MIEGADQFDLGFAPAVNGWQRYPRGYFTDYQLFEGGKPSGLWVCHCGHPTANRPYYIALPSGEVIGRKFRTSELAKAAAVIDRSGGDFEEALFSDRAILARLPR